MRRGQYADFDPSKMTPGEWAVAIDNDTTKQIIWMCFAPGVVKRIGTYEDYIRMIDEYIAENYSEYIPDVICPVETTSIASKAYAVGDLVITNVHMYKVTQAIAQGDNLVPTVNLSETTVENELKEGSQGDVQYGMIASVEETSTASKAYNEGEYLIYNGTLYKVTSSISSGGTLTPNTNITAVIVGDELTHLNTAEIDTYSMIGTYEPTLIASKNYYVGDYVIANGKLYKMTDFCWQGATLVPDYNMQETTLQAEIQAANDLPISRGDSGTEGSAVIGGNSDATSDYAVAEGYGTTASGTGAHSEGASTLASGYASHAEGNSTEASGDYSHAEGQGTIAASEAQHVSGKYNVQDDNDTYAEIVGGGDDTTPANIRTLDWAGNATYAGKVTAGADAVNNNDVPRLGQVNTALAGKKNTQNAVSDPTASGNTLSFIDSISQDAQGVITPTKKNVTTDATPTASSTNPVQSGGVKAALDAQKYFYVDAEGYGCINYDLF